MASATRQRLLETGLAMLLEHGYNGLGIHPLLSAAGVPKGSFYHYFQSKEAFALAVLDYYMAEVHAGLDRCLDDRNMPPLQRVRTFFELSADKYRREGYLGCLLGGVGQELAGTHEVFRRKVEWCFARIVERITACLDEARRSGDLAHDADARQLAELLLDCWEGAALRSRLRRDAAPLSAMLDFYFDSAAGGTAAASASDTPADARRRQSRSGRTPRDAPPRPRPR